MSIPDKDLSLLLNRRDKQRLSIIISSLSILIIFTITAVCMGAANITAKEVVDIILARFQEGRTEGISPGKYSIIWDIRLPRIIMALLCGVSLSTGGVAMQGVLRNPLVSPYTLGISAASAFGASLAIVTGHNELIIPGAFITSICAVTFILILARFRGIKSESLILSGIAVMYAFSAGTSLLQYMATQDQLAKIVFWLMGSLSSTTWTQTGMTAIVVLIISPLLYSLSWKLNIMESGDDTAKSLGINPSMIMVVIVISVTLMTSVIVSFTGVIGFIGLASPHIARLMLGSDHRVLFPASSIIGAFILLVSDTMARSLLGNTELPIGIITSFIGVPFLISILMNRQKGSL